MRPDLHDAPVSRAGSSLSFPELAESLELPEDVIAARLKGLGLETGAATMKFD